MGRELQKKKNKSSRPKVRRDKKSKKRILSNPIVAAHWNSKETLTQNYRRIGLVSKLNKRAGGVESASKAALASDSLAIARPAVLSRAAPVAEVPLERDPATGEVVVGGGGGNHAGRANPLNDPLIEVLDASEPEEWDGFGNVPAGGAGGGEQQKPAVEALEQLAASGVRKAPRKQSEREEEWIAALVDRYGDDYGRMVRDRKLNPMQQTAGDIKRRVVKWRKKQQEVEAGA